MIDLIEAHGPDQISLIRELFLEYASALGIDLCFQGFSEELKQLPGDYAPPSGRLLLARYEGELAGCIALRKWDEAACEMKRLYVRRIYRKLGIGRELVGRLIDEARQAGYRRMRLDTLPQMWEALSLYRSLGFVEIEAFRENPIPGAKYFEMTL